jgi:hypothetical protein
VRSPQELPSWDGVDLGGQPLLRDVAPGLAAAAAEALLAEGEPAIAATVDELRVERECGCGERSCRSIHTIPPAWAPDGDAQTIDGAGTLIYAIDVQGERITYIEILVPERRGRHERRR